ncbi:MAG: nucleoside diphosphate kinase regulator [Phycisphaerae bacterium]|nr:nucleoside diphosphate kinase regulator [Phycisphaerae bacterium]
MAAFRNIVLTQGDYVRLAQLVQALRYAQDAETKKCIEQIQHDLNDAHVVAADDIPHDVVTMGSRVQFVDADTREESAYTVVWPDEASVEQAKVSVLAPIGLALLGCRVEDEVNCHTPAGLRRLRITDVLYQPEAAARETQAEPTA